MKGIMALLLLLLIGCTMPEKEMITIGFAGDTMLGRLVNDHISLSNYSYPWGNIMPILKETDLNIINLETTLTRSNKAVPKVFNSKADPEVIESLVRADIDVVNLANNHILDFSEEGLLDTISTLDKAEIFHVGAGLDITGAKEPIIITKHGITIGIIGYTDNEPEWEAGMHNPGTNYVKVGDIYNVKKDIDKIRHEVDILIATIHWGPNMREHPSQAFVDFAHQMIDAGIDIIHGHSAHVFQGIEIYNKKLIMYDTGDFVNDYAVDPDLRNDRSFIFLVDINKEGIKEIRLIPTLISHMQVNHATATNYRESIERIKESSEKFGTHIEERDGMIIIENN
ncbi:CapA family protein [Candidatus Woesearchaeota archaeon]|jgi:poly-gamma-glutamate synthesis protein (capsule biosynthesis protein)|nr:CapA family protein [Candidatus Woesearchaeota archaeon]